MKERIKFAVVGCGHIGKRHAEMINRNPDAELVGLRLLRQMRIAAQHPMDTMPSRHWKVCRPVNTW